MSQSTLHTFRRTGRDEREYAISDFEVTKEPRDVCRSFIADHHYSGGCGSAVMTWGVRHDPTGELVGAIAFQKPISTNVTDAIFGGDVCACDAYEDTDGCNRQTCETDRPHHHVGTHVTELHRLATLDVTPQNTETWFIARALDRLKKYKPHYKAVVSFADSTEGHTGTVYQAANALYYGTSRPATFYRDTDGRLRPPRNGGENISVTEARERGWEPVEREAKHRYLFLLPDPYESKDDLKNDLQVELQSYPSSL